MSALPYVFAGLFLSLLFALWRERATEIYFADLLGAGVVARLSSGCSTAWRTRAP